MRHSHKPTPPGRRRFLLLGLLAAGWGLVPLRAQAPTPVGAEFQVNTETVRAQATPAVTRDGAGRFVVVWNSFFQDGVLWGVFGQRYDAAGGALGAEFQINTTTLYSQQQPDVAADAAGNFLVVWDSFGQDGDGTGVVARRYDSAGAPLTGEFLVNAYTTSWQRRPAIAGSGPGGFLVVWEGGTALQPQDGDREGIFARRLDSAGAPQGAEFQVNTYTTSRQTSPALFGDPAGNFVVVWDSFGQDGASAGIFGQRLNSAGTPEGGEFQVNAYTTSSQYAPAIAGDAAGHFVVVWESDGPDGSGQGIVGRRFDSAGAPRGGEFVVNTATLNAQGQPALLGSGPGHFLVVWASDGPDGDGDGVFGQRFDAAGAPLGSEFQINTYTTGTQGAPAVAGEPGGEFVVVWQSYFQDGDNYGLFGQRFCGPVVATVSPDQAACPGAPVTFTVTPTGTGPFTYQWRHNGVPLFDGSRVAGATTPTLTLTGVSAVDAGAYDCLVTDACPAPNTVTAPSATLTVGAVTVSTPADQTACPGGVALFAVTAGGPGPFTYQWRRNGVPLSDGGLISGATTPTLTLTGVSAADAGTYDCQVTNGCAAAGVGASPAATLRVGWIGLTPPLDQAVCAGASATFPLTATGAGPLTYQWRHNGVPLADGGPVSGATTDTLTLDPVAVAHAGRYDCLVTDACAPANTATSPGATLAVPCAGPAAAGAAFQVNTYTTHRQTRPVVAGDAAGNFVIAWQSGDYYVYGQDGFTWGTFGQAFNAAGVPVGAEFQANSYTTDAQYQPAIAADPAGNFVMVWASAAFFITGQDGDSWGIFGQRTDSTGTPLGGEFQVNSTIASYQWGPGVAAGPGGEFVVTWNSPDGDDYGIFAQRYDSAGTPAGGEFQVNSTTTGFAYQSTAAYDGAGNFLVVWVNANQDGSPLSVFAQAYDSTGAAQGGEFQVNAFTPGAQFQPAVTADPAGTFTVVWTSDQKDGDGSGVFGRRFDAAGTPRGGEFQVNTTTAAGQYRPGIAADGAGNFVVVWTSDQQDGNSGGVFAQAFDAAGTRLGPEFQVNTYTSGFQGGQQVHRDPAGNFVVTWQSDAPGGHYEEVWARRFCAPPVVTGPAPPTACLGDRINLSVTGAGTGPFTYQWRRDGVNLTDGGAVTGAATPTLTLDPVGAGEAGRYDCLVTDACATPAQATSALVTLTVGTPALTGCTPSGGAGPSDLDCGGCVDGIDLGLLGRSFGQACGDAAYDGLSDLDGDGLVDGADLAVLVADFGRGCT